MKKTQFLSVLFLYSAILVTLLIFSSCSAKVIKNIYTYNLPQQDTTLPVMIYTDTTQIPPETIIIGSLAIVDGGSTTKCDSALVFNLANTETRKAGGNAFLLTRYTKPSF